MQIPIALQLYTLRNETAVDFEGVLEKIAQIGYRGVEFAGYGNLKSGQMVSLLKRLNLSPAGSHVPLDLLKNKVDEIIEYNLEIGNKYIICPYAKYESKGDYIDFARFLEKAGEKIRSKGLVLGYHNHAHEFIKYDDKYALDIIFENTQEEVLVMELDTYWVQYAGVNPVEYLKKYNGRCSLIHQKDMKKEDRSFTEVGEGIMDIKAIYEEGLNQKVSYFIVEQDLCTIPPLESVQISFNNLRKMGFV